MKKRYTILLIVCFSIITSQCFTQVPFPDTTHQQKWEVKTWNFFTCRTNIYKTGNTANFCQNQYIEIFSCDENEQNCNLFGYYRVAGPIVYLRGSMNCNKQELRTYDFSASVGQTVSCPINAGSTFCTNSDFTVQSLQPVYYEGIPRDTRAMQYPLQNSFRYMNWIEGIGSDVHPFYPLSFLDITNDYYTLVVKVHRNGQLIYFDNSVNLICYYYVSPKLLLEGPYDNATGEMTLGLNSSGLVPTTEPYTAMGMHGGMETTTAAVIANNSIVDWVLVQLRDEENPSFVRESRAALIDNMGNIYDTDGVSPIEFFARKCTYYVSVFHRNHLSVMTANPITLAGTVTNLDFTTIPLYGNDAAKIENGAQVLWAGDSNLDGTVNANDRSNVWNDRNQTNYLETDFTLDGVVNAADRSVCWNNRNRVAQLP